MSCNWLKCSQADEPLPSNKSNQMDAGQFKTIDLSPPTGKAFQQTGMTQAAKNIADLFTGIASSAYEQIQFLQRHLIFSKSSK